MSYITLRLSEWFCRIYSGWSIQLKRILAVGMALMTSRDNMSHASRAWCDWCVLVCVQTTMSQEVSGTHAASTSHCWIQQSRSRVRLSAYLRRSVYAIIIIILFYWCAILCISAAYGMALCLCVCLSVTFVHYIERCIRLFSSPSGSPIFYTEYYGEIPTGSPVTGHDLYVAEIYRPRAIYEMPSFSYLFRILKIAYGIKYSNVCLFDKYNQITSARPLTVA